ncbi:MAG: response regulator transcription factor [Phenylobacterium sp.]|nr:MAG: response regulator transcription factor [Phenylobacterium sp.]
MQPTLREDPPEVRERTGHAVRASRPDPVTGRVVVRVLLLASAVALFLSLFGPFNIPAQTIMLQVGERFGYAWVGSLLGLSAARIAWRLGLWSRGPIVIGLATGVLMAPAMIVVVLVSHVLFDGASLNLTLLSDVLWDTLLICIGASVLAVLINRSAGQAAAREAGPVRFLDRIPLKLRGGELWAVEAEDHYLRLHTSRGQDLILLRLADAIDELEGIEGAQVHRSWWVARDAIADARRGDGRATLTLKDGSEVPVSRTYARILRDRRWI